MGQRPWLRMKLKEVSRDQTVMNTWQQHAKVLETAKENYWSTRRTQWKKDKDMKINRKDRSKIKEMYPMNKCISYVSLVAEVSENQLLSPKGSYWQDPGNSLCRRRKTRELGWTEAECLPGSRELNGLILIQSLRKMNSSPGWSFYHSVQNLNSRGADSHSFAEGRQDSQINGPTDCIQWGKCNFPQRNQARVHDGLPKMQRQKVHASKQYSRREGSTKREEVLKGLRGRNPQTEERPASSSQPTTSSIKGRSVSPR